jgi:hypothetical protein
MYVCINEISHLLHFYRTSVHIIAYFELLKSIMKPAAIVLTWETSLQEQCISSDNSYRFLFLFLNYEYNNSLYQLSFILVC